jgi:hypothetical protein
VDCEDNCEKYLIMGFGFSPKIVTDGLVLYLDAANRKSYNGSGTDWNNLSIGDYQGTLVSSPEFQSDKSGNFYFNGVNSYTSISGGGGLNNQQTATIDIWVKWVGTQDADVVSSYGPIIARQKNASFSNNILALNGSDPDTAKIIWKPYAATGIAITSSNSPGDDVWKNVVITFESGSHLMYINGEYEASGSTTGTISDDSSIVLSLGAWIDDGVGYFSGNTSGIKVYDRILTSDEIRNNYNSIRGRFFNGLVNEGLIAHYDAKDKRSHPGNTLRWNDVSGNNYNMTLDTSLFTYNSNDGTFTLEGGGTTYNGSFTTATTCTAVIWLKTTDAQSSFLNGQTNYYLGLYTSSNKEAHANSGSPDFYMDLIDRPNIYDYAIDGNWHMFEFKNVDFSAWTSLNFSQLGSYYFANGEVAIISIYDRNLTAAESAQNFTAFRTRFGI